MALVASATAQEPPPEFGTIRWQRDLAAAKDTARAEQLPLLLLFQEVPG